MPGKRSVYLKRNGSREPASHTQPLKSKLSKLRNTLSKSKSKNTVSKTTASNTVTKTPGTATKTPISRDTVTKTPDSKGTRSKPKQEVVLISPFHRKYPWEDAKYDKFRESAEKDEDDEEGEDPKIRLCFVDKREKDTNEKELVEIPTDEIGRFDQNIENLYYFHGFLAREDAEALLDQDGDFLIRECEFERHCHYVISAQYQAQPHHILVKTTRTKKLYWTYKYAFRSIVDLAIYHSRNGVAVYKDIVLVRGIGKQGWQINHEQVVGLKKLGGGNFGDVFRGTLITHVMKNGVEVAVKQLKQGELSGAQKQAFLKEARLMLPFRHPCVARLYGVCTMRQPIMLVLEYCENGALDSILKKSNPKVQMEQKVTWLYHAACGLEYVHSKQIVHRDIAARNCLVTGQNILKISDFGLSRMGTKVRENMKGDTPYNYMAPEAIRGYHSSASDMFSYTALMFEVLLDGQMPYEDAESQAIDPQTRVHMLAAFELPLEFKPPHDTPTFLYNIYDNCRVAMAKMRLTATEVMQVFEEQGDCRPFKPPNFIQRMKEKWRNMFKGFHL